MMVPWKKANTKPQGERARARTMSPSMDGGVELFQFWVERD